MSTMLNDLTEREIDVLSAMAEGLSNKAIADKLFISVETVRWYARQIYRKLDVSNRTQASVIARDAGLLEDENGDAVRKAVVNLPSYPSQFVGRHTDLEKLTQWLADDSIRLVTIVGPGGIGKTRLGVELAQQHTDNFSDGVHFIAMNDPRLQYETLSETLRRVLNIEDNQADNNWLAGADLLLLFDNFEQSLDHNQGIADLLAATDRLKIIVTSQIPINLQQEWLYRIDGLSTGNYSQSYSDAVTLFADRVRRVSEEFDLDANLDDVRELCSTLNGYPLAIELAATWVRSLSCAEIINEVRASMDILASQAPDLPQRHRSIYAVFEYAWRLLTDDQQQAMRRLSIFQGEFGVKAAQQVAGTSTMTLASLVDRSLIFKTGSGLYRIHNLLRQYALDKLKANDAHGPQSNVALAVLSLINGRFDRVEELAEQLLAHAPDQYNIDKGFGLALLGVIAGARGEYQEGLQLGDSSLDLTQQLPMAAFFSYLGTGISYCGSGDYAAARQVIGQALDAAQTLQTDTFVMMCFPVMALVAANSGQFDDALVIYSAAVHESANLPDWLRQWEHFDKLYDDLEETLSQDRFDNLWQQGISADVPEIIAVFAVN